MRVYYSDTSYINFLTATHWESIDGDWVELADDDGNIVGILNWKKVWLMRPLSDVEIEAIKAKETVI